MMLHVGMFLNATPLNSPFTVTDNVLALKLMISFTTSFVFSGSQNCCLRLLYQIDPDAIRPQE